MSRSRSARRPTTTIAAVCAAVLALLVALVASGPASARMDRPSAVPPPPNHPTSADQIQNIGQVTSAIKAYYGDTLSGRTNPDNTAEHVPSPTGAYAKELAGIERNAEHYLGNHAVLQPGAPTEAIVLDVDDTSLNTYNYEIDSNFTYNPVANAAFVNGALFPAVFGMNDLANYAKGLGYSVFFLTGRPETQRAGTDTNLTEQGFPVIDSQVYLKDLTKPIYASCYRPPTSTCTTARYKTLTRRYIESLGYDIVANFGDQYSDLRGGFADLTVKLPNPMYFLP